ncbi:hypothetical protein WMY93_026051 [Mugilogobius chulae]|uniref:Uncharacterized protein n=1 Tax=Mugilogobius chulae TaxID=88201 RepID=A0AAW0N881_9GOBI
MLKGSFRGAAHQSRRSGRKKQPRAGREAAGVPLHEDRSGAQDRQTLRGIGCNDEAEELESRYAALLKVSAQFHKKAPRVKKPKPSVEPLGVVSSNGTAANRPQAELKKKPKAEKTALSGQLLQFGKYKLQSFEWLLQNDVSYAVYVVGTHLNDRHEGNGSQTQLMKNKDALAEYAGLSLDVMEEVHFYREGLAPLGFGKYGKLTRQELYDSANEMIKGYVNWLRSMKNKGEGAQMEAVLEYISHRDGKAGVCPCSTALQPKRRSYSGTRSESSPKKPRL